MSIQTIRFGGSDYSLETLGNLSGPELVKLHNNCAGLTGLPETKRFSDKSAALKRTWAVLQAYGSDHSLVDAIDGAVESVDKLPKVTPDIQEPHVTPAPELPETTGGLTTLEREGGVRLASQMSIRDLEWQIANQRKLRIPGALQKIFVSELARRRSETTSAPAEVEPTEAEAPVKHNEEQPTMATAARKKATPAKTAKAHAEPVARGFAEDAKIKVLVKENPRRGAAAERFEIYKTGMTVAEFSKKIGSRAEALVHLRWDVNKGHISVS